LVPLPGRLLPPQHLPDIVFSDLGSIPLGPDSGEYWGAWLTHHLFFFDGTDDGVAAAVGPGVRVSLAPPQGSTSRLVCLSHANTGGSTSRRWVLAVVEPLTWELRGGTLLLCCVNDRVASWPFLGTRRSGVAGKCVEWEEGVVMDFGLFPASDLTARVLLESSGSPSGYGLRSLSARELGDLWDVPILFMDFLLDQEVGDLMGAICRTPPSNLLHSGADLLLTSCFRGGIVGGLLGQGCLPGPRPRSDSDLGLAPTAKRHRPSEECDALAAEAEEYVGGDEVKKGDSQKVDDAAVPDH